MVDPISRASMVRCSFSFLGLVTAHSHCARRPLTLRTAPRFSQIPTDDGQVRQGHTEPHLRQKFLDTWLFLRRSIKVTILLQLSNDAMRVRHALARGDRLNYSACSCRAAAPAAAPISTFSSLATSSRFTLKLPDASSSSSSCARAGSSDVHDRASETPFFCISTPHRGGGVVSPWRAPGSRAQSTRRGCA